MLMETKAVAAKIAILRGEAFALHRLQCVATTLR
jgi:hypothetical protein